MRTKHSHLELRDDARRFRRSLTGAVVFTAFVWVIWLASEALQIRLYPWGVQPRTAQGLLGILFAPLLHGSLGHIISNTLPLVMLGTMMRYMYPKASRFALPIIWFGSGFLVWVVARDSSHLGASGVVYGMMFFLFAAGMLRNDVRSLALSLLVFFFYGGMIWGLFPGEPGVSFESHVCGAAVGFVLALILRVLDPPIAPQQYYYEFEEELERKAQERGEFWPDPLDGEWRYDPENDPHGGPQLPPPPGLLRQLFSKKTLDWILSHTRRY